MFVRFASHYAPDIFQISRSAKVRFESIVCLLSASDTAQRHTNSQCHPHPHISPTLLLSPIHPPQHPLHSPRLSVSSSRTVYTSATFIRPWTSVYHLPPQQAHPAHNGFLPPCFRYTLIQVFSKFGKLVRLDYLFHKTGALRGKPRGYAFVEYSSDQVSAPAHPLAARNEGKNKIKRFCLPRVYLFPTPFNLSYSGSVPPTTRGIFPARQMMGFGWL